MVTGLGVFEQLAKRSKTQAIPSQQPEQAALVAVTCDGCLSAKPLILRNCADVTV
jgi:hypothetical protein